MALIEISAAISVANIFLLSALLIVYAKIYHSSRAIFTVGLMFFASMLLLHNIITVYAYFAMAPLYAEGLLPYFIVVHLAELVGIAALLKVTL